MSDEKERNPILDLKDIPLLGDPIKIRLDCAKAVKEDEGKYGTWYLWFGFVENATVREGKERKLSAKPYTGKVIFFPTGKLNEQLVKLADGKVEVDVSIKKIVEETTSGKIIKKYVAEKLSEGKEPEFKENDFNMTPTELKLVTDTQKMLQSGYEINVELFVKASQQPIYNGSITPERAKELYTELNGKK